MYYINIIINIKKFNKTKLDIFFPLNTLHKKIYHVTMYVMKETSYNKKDIPNLLWLGTLLICVYTNTQA